jgi:hypothetical protein
MKIVWQRRIAPCVAIAVVALIGCSGSADERQKVVPVSGSVTYNGQPVAGATVVFLTKGSSPGATGQTASDGTFRLTTYDEGDGAAPGRYSVTVTKLEGAASGDPNAPFDPVADMEAAARKTAPPPPARSLLPTKYSTAAQSPLEFTVEASGNNRFEIELKD